MQIQFSSRSTQGPALASNAAFQLPHRDFEFNLIFIFILCRSAISVHSRIPDHGCCFGGVPAAASAVRYRSQGHNCSSDTKAIGHYFNLRDVHRYGNSHVILSSRCKPADRLGVFIASADEALVISTYSAIASQFHHLSQGSWLLLAYNFGYCISLPVVRNGNA